MNQNRSRSTFIYLLLFAAIIILVVYNFQTSAAAQETLPINQVAADIRAGKIARISDDDNRVRVVYKDDPKIERISHKEASSTLVEQLKELGVTERTWILPGSKLRSGVVDFTLKTNEKQKMAELFFNRIKSVLTQEKVEFDQKVVAELIKKFFPDFRRVINEVQRYSQFGKIDVGILTHIGDMEINEVVKLMKEKDFGALRKWVAGRDIEPHALYRKLYDNMYTILKKESIPQIVLLLADYQYKQAFVADASEINVMACLTELMLQCEFV